MVANVAGVLDVDVLLLELVELVLPVLLVLFVVAVLEPPPPPQPATSAIAAAKPNARTHFPLIRNMILFVPVRYWMSAALTPVGNDCGR